MVTVTGAPSHVIASRSPLYTMPSTGETTQAVPAPNTSFN